jgi:hypothetical protein
VPASLSSRLLFAFGVDSVSSLGVGRVKNSSVFSVQSDSDSALVALPIAREVWLSELKSFALSVAVHSSEIFRRAWPEPARVGC